MNRSRRRESALIWPPEGSARTDVRGYGEPGSWSVPGSAPRSLIALCRKLCRKLCRSSSNSTKLPTKLPTKNGATLAKRTVRKLQDAQRIIFAVVDHPSGCLFLKNDATD